MAVDFDEFPVYDPITKPNDKLSDVWIASFSSFLQTLKSYLSQFGMFVPHVTTAQRDSIQSPQEGQMIYNTDLLPRPAPQIFQVGVWRTFTTVP